MMRNEENIMEITVRDSLMQYISDGHKDAYGFRPDLSRYSEWSEDELSAECDRISDAVGESIRVEEQQQAEALAEWERQIALAMVSGAADRDTAIEWLIGAEQFDASDLAYGSSYVSWHFGMRTSNSEPHNIEIQRIIDNRMKSQIDAYFERLHADD
jgi:hypothetical protein